MSSISSHINAQLSLNEIYPLGKSNLQASTLCLSAMRFDNCKAHHELAHIVSNTNY